MPPQPQRPTIPPLALLPNGTLIRVDQVQYAHWDPESAELSLIVGGRESPLVLDGEEAKEVHGLLQAMAGISRGEEEPAMKLAVPDKQIVMP